MVHRVIRLDHDLVVLVGCSGANGGKVQTLRAVNHMPVTYQVWIVCYYT
jgi:hypothetical protein